MLRMNGCHGRHESTTRSEPKCVLSRVLTTEIELLASRVEDTIKLLNRSYRTKFDARNPPPKEVRVWLLEF